MARKNRYIMKNIMNEVCYVGHRSVKTPIRPQYMFCPPKKIMSRTFWISSALMWKLQNTLCKNWKVYSQHLSVYSQNLSVYSQHLSVYSQHSPVYSQEHVKSWRGHGRGNYSACLAPRSASILWNRPYRAHAAIICHVNGTCPCLYISRCRLLWKELSQR